MEHYQVEIHVSPAKESYEIGSQATLNCIATPLPQKYYRNFTFPVYYRWYSSGGSFNYFNFGDSASIEIGNHQQSPMKYYCSIYRNGVLLGRGRRTLTIEGVLKQSISPMKIQMQRANITLQVNTSNHDILYELRELTWYHNGSKIVPGSDPRMILSNNNKTPTISNFTSRYAGMYKAQFDHLLVPLFDEICENRVISVMRHCPILKPAVFCINMDGNDCNSLNSLSTTGNQERRISVWSMDSTLQGTFDRLTLEADATVPCSNMLQYFYISWYRNGISISSAPYLSALQRNYNNISLRQRFQQLNASYEHSGRYEVQLTIDLYSYLESTCPTYLNNFAFRYFFFHLWSHTLARGFIDVEYHKGLVFILDSDKKATTVTEGATLTCQASIDFPPFSMLSLMKSGLVVSSSINGSLQINIKSIDTNPFGLHTCQLNASGAIFQKSYLLKEQANLKMTISIKSCSQNELITTKYIEETLIKKIKHDCQCNFNLDGFQNSTINCEGSNELVYTTTLEYSNEEGSETASIIGRRIVEHVPFSMTVEDSQLRVKSASTDCEMSKVLFEMPTTNTTSLSPAVGGGLFAGGFATAILIIVVPVTIATQAMKKYAKSGAKSGKVKNDPRQYAFTGATHLNSTSFKGSEHTPPYPKKPSEYQVMGLCTHDQPNPCETMEPSDQPIYEETF